MPFPANPSVGDTYVENNNTYKYLGSVNGWYRTEVRPTNDTTYIGSNGAPGGLSGDTQVIFNNAGSLASDAGLTYNSTTDRLTAGSFFPTSSTAPTNGLYLSGTNMVGISTGGTGRLFIDASGNVGVGINSPEHKLSIEGTTYAGASFSSTRYSSTLASGSELIFRRSVSDTPGVNAAVTAGTKIGGILFSGANGSSYSPGFNIVSTADSDWSTATRTSYLSIRDASAASERIRIRADGMFEVKGAGTAGVSPAFSVSGSAPANSLVILPTTGYVGLGSTNPASNLHVQGAVSGTNIRVQGSAASDYTFLQAINSSGVELQLVANGNSEARINTVTNHPLAFYTNNQRRVDIDASGRLLVGTNGNTGGSLFQVNDNRIRIATAKTPASATDTGSAGEICWDADYIYVCTATNTWKRTAIATW